MQWIFLAVNNLVFMKTVLGKIQPDTAASGCIMDTMKVYVC